MPDLALHILLYDGEPPAHRTDPPQGRLLADVSPQQDECEGRFTAIGSVEASGTARYYRIVCGGYGPVLSQGTVHQEPSWLKQTFGHEEPVPTQNVIKMSAVDLKLGECLHMQGVLTSA